MRRKCLCAVYYVCCVSNWISHFCLFISCNRTRTCGFKNCGAPRSHLAGRGPTQVSNRCSSKWQTIEGVQVGRSQPLHRTGRKIDHRSELQGFVTRWWRFGSDVIAIIVIDDLLANVSSEVAGRNTDPCLGRC